MTWTDWTWLLSPITSPDSRTFGPLVLLAVLVGGAVEHARGTPWRAALGAWITPWRHPSARLDVRLLVVHQAIELLRVLPGAGMSAAIALGLVHHATSLLGESPFALPTPAWAALYSVCLAVGWDASRWLVHLAMHRVPVLWRFHQVHHSAEVLTPFTFHRVHPVESAIMTVRGTVVTGGMAGAFLWAAGASPPVWSLLGVHAIGFVLNAFSGNLRHSHVWWRWGRIESWWLSPAQHQLHHAEDPKLQNSNFGTWLAIWDRWAGTWRPAPEAPPSRLGLRAQDRNHDPHRLLDALVGPLRPGARAAVALSAGVWAAESAAQDVEILVVEPDGTPRLAGSAHAIGEEELQRHAYDDIQRVLATVPGVYARTEDGFGLRPNIGMRGGSSDRSAKILLMEDGVPLAPAPYAAPAAYFFPLVSRMVGVEVIKGPASIRFGPQTIGGAINLVSRGVPIDGPVAALDVAGGTFTTLRGHAWAGVGGERAGVIADVSHLSSAGFKELDGGDAVGFSRQDALLSARVGAQEDRTGHGVTFKVGYGRERSHETYLGLSAEDVDADPYRRYAASALDAMVSDRAQGSAAWSWRAPQGATLRVTAYGHHLARVWDKLNGFSSGIDLHDLLRDPDPNGTNAVYLAILRGEEDTASPDQALVRGANDRRYDNAGVATTFRTRDPVLGGTNELELGLRVHGDAVTRHHTEATWWMTDGVLVRDDADATVTLDTFSTALAVAAHAHDTWTRGPLTVVPGARLESIRTTTGPTDGPSEAPQRRTTALPGLGLMVAVAPWLDVLAGAHRGFSPAPPEADPTATPESAWNLEAGARLNPGETDLEAVGFFSDYGNLVGICTLSSGCSDDAIGQQFGAGSAWVYGVESLVGQVVHLPGRVDLRAEATYTWTEAQFREAFASDFPEWGDVAVGDRLPYLPAHQGSATLGVDHPVFGAEVLAAGRSAMRDTAGQDPIAASRLPGIVTVDLGATVHLGDHLDLYGTTTNLLGTAVVASWRPSGAFPSAPRTLSAGLRGRL